MNETNNTFLIEDSYYIPFADKTHLSIEKGDGVYVWDEDSKRYLDFTSGWGVTCIGHASPIITEALCTQSKKIIQNPNSGATYSPARSRLIQLFHEILPEHLTRIFFANSGAEANDAAIKLARKITGKKNVISTEMSFHGRTISTVSATGQDVHRNKFNPLMPGYFFVPFNDISAVKEIIDQDVAAVIVEPIQGEGGVNIPSESYLQELSEVCRKHGVLFIADEIQTGFFRTGPLFYSISQGARPDIITMAKGIAGGFPFSAFAVTDEVAYGIQKGDHGGTYNGNPLGCAVSEAVIRYMVDLDIESHVTDLGSETIKRLNEWKEKYPKAITEVRGQGLLIALELTDDSKSAEIVKRCLDNGLILNLKHGHIIRIFPALTITKLEMQEGLDILEKEIITCYS
ncbi:MAG: aspartate aminotransferase family protein [Methanospirillum sp.]|uniref:aspartate aminotransferase family protein n=1 Tax=Methanospirillum sp. TaxID=45200 RepID=UPI0023753FBA|nr:aspartate aminotransferase family protein [Methanospirillum sp.]MDD1730399.1 aspartate aminotransferase family protein [Methanospirillum sp.]